MSTRQIWSFCVKRVEAKREGNPPKCAALGVGTWMTPRNMIFPQMYYLVEFGRSRSNRMSVSWCPKSMGRWGPAPLGWGVADSLEYALPQMC